MYAVSRMCCAAEPVMSATAVCGSATRASVNLLLLKSSVHDPVTSASSLAMPWNFVYDFTNGFVTDETFGFKTASVSDPVCGTRVVFTPQYSLPSTTSWMPGVPTMLGLSLTAPRVTLNVNGKGGMTEPDTALSPVM